MFYLFIKETSLNSYHLCYYVLIINQMYYFYRYLYHFLYYYLYLFHNFYYLLIIILVLCINTTIIINIHLMKN